MSNKSLLQFADEVSRFHPELMRRFLRRQTKEIARYDISPAQMLILDILNHKNSMRMGELAKYLSVSLPATTGIVDRLMKLGLVVRANSPVDRRVVNIDIAAKGKKIVKECRQAKQRTIIEIFGGLSEADRDKYLEILRKILNRLQEKQP